MEKTRIAAIMLTLLLVGVLASTLNVLSSGPEATMQVEPKTIGALGLVATDWNKTCGGSGNDVARSVVQTTDGGYAMAGFTNSSGAGGYDFWLVKTDLSGSVQWNKTYGGSGDDEAYSVVQTTDGGYAVAGYTNSYGAGSNDFWLVKTDTNGNMQWNKTYGGTNNDAASALVRTTDGGYALAGETQSFGGGGRPTFWLVKTDTSGNVQWNKTYSLSSADYASALVQTSDGGYALAGTGGSLPPPYPNYCELVKTNASGNMQWSKSYGGTSGDEASALVRTTDGGYALAGETKSFGAGGYDFWLVKTDTNGNMQWNKTYGGTGTDEAYSVVQTNDGGYALAGYTNSFGAGGYDFWLVKTDLSGSVQWNKTYGGSGVDEAYSVVQTTDGGYAMAGFTNSSGAGGYDFWLAKLTPTTICINSDGSIYPSTAPIQQNANVYTFTDNIYTTADVGIMIERNNMTLDGAGYVLDGGGVGSIGISASATTNVTVRNLNIHAFGHGIYLSGSSNNMIIESNVTDCPSGIVVMSSSGNTLAGNQVANSEFEGILLCPPESGEGSSNNTITGNTLTNNTWGVYLTSSSNNFLSENIIRTSSNTGIWIEDSSDNVIAGNNMTMNYQGIETSSCSNDSIYHNNFVNNSYKQASTSGSTDVWNEGYPSGGNYWSDYNGTDLRGGPYQNETGSDGIGDTPYVIDVNNRDNYPLMQPYSAHSTRYSWPTFHHDESHSGYSESPASGTNNKLWNYTTGNKVYSSPAVADGRVYVGSWDNRTYCLDASTGAQMWNYTTGSYVFSSPAVAGGRVYVGSSDGRVYCLDASSGVQVWNYTTGSGVFSSPAVADGVLYVGSEDGSVYAFGTVLRVPEGYKTIQAAINAAAPGATIWVDPGVYSESLVINKTIMLIGKPGSEPIFNGGGSGIAVRIVSSGSGSTIAGITITSWDQGVLVDGASGCKIYDDIMSLTNNAIAFQGTSAASNQVYSNIFQQDAVGVDVTSSSQGNTISQNIFKLSTVGLKVETGGNIIYANMISDNQLGMSLVNSDNNVVYHNDFVDNTYAVQMSFTTSTGNKWDDGYPQGGNYWASYTGVDKKAGPNQDIPGSDGIGDTPYTIAVNNTDNYPLVKPFNEHDIGIAVFIVSKTVIFRGFKCNMTVSILNYGLYNETFNLAIWANQTRINLQSMVLTNRSSIQTTFVWNTTGLPYGKYNLTSVVDTVPGETDTADNNLTGGWVFVSTVGDLTGGTSNPWDFVPDGKVDGKDIAIVAMCFGSAPGCPPPYRWNANCDVNNDAKIDGADIATVALHFGQAGP